MPEHDSHEMAAEHFQELAELDASYWWFKVRFNLVVRLLSRIKKLDSYGSIVDWGCGCGAFLHFLHAEKNIPADRLLGFEPSPLAHEHLKKRRIPFRTPDFEKDLCSQFPAPPDGVVLLDVLEHIEKPTEFLAKLFAAAAPGAALVITVPAMQKLWSVWDEKLGHYRRYDRTLLERQLSETGWQVVQTRYFFTSLYFVALFRQRLISSKKLPETEFPRLPGWLNSLVGLAFSLEARLPLLPFGTSVAALAVKKKHP